MLEKHYRDLFTTKTNPKYDDEFRTFVEAKITEYECESFNAENDPLDNAFTEHEVLVAFFKLPNGKASGPDGLTYEHIKYAGITLSPKLTRIFNALREFEIVSDSFVLGDIRLYSKISLTLECDSSEMHSSRVRMYID